jgi:hypothetical protein
MPPVGQGRLAVQFGKFGPQDFDFAGRDDAQFYLVSADLQNPDFNFFADPKRLSHAPP